IPQAVTYDEHGQVSSFNPVTITALLVSSVQQLDAQVQTLMSGQLTQLHVSGNAAFAGTVTFNGKIISRGVAPTAQVGTVLTAVLGASVTNSGTDTAGTVTIVSGSQASLAGEIADITFATAYGSEPKIVLSGNNAKSAKLGAYVVRTATGFKIFTDEPLELDMTYSFDYIIIEAQAVL